LGMCDPWLVVYETTREVSWRRNMRMSRMRMRERLAGYAAVNCRSIVAWFGDQRGDSYIK